MRQYLGLPKEMVGTYGGYYCDENFLSSLEHLLQVRIFILRCTNTDHDSNAGRLHHIGQRNFTEPYTEYLKTMLHPQFNREDNTMFYPLRVIFLVRRANCFELLVPRSVKHKAMLPSEIPNLPLSLLGLQGTDVQLKDTARNHDSHVIAYNQKTLNSRCRLTVWLLYLKYWSKPTRHLQCLDFIMELCHQLLGISVATRKAMK